MRTCRNKYLDPLGVVLRNAQPSRLIVGQARSLNPFRAISKYEHLAKWIEHGRFAISTWMTTLLSETYIWISLRSVIDGPERGMRSQWHYLLPLSSTRGAA